MKNFSDNSVVGVTPGHHEEWRALRTRLSRWHVSHFLSNFFRNIFFVLTFPNFIRNIFFVFNFFELFSKYFFVLTFRTLFEIFFSFYLFSYLIRTVCFNFWGFRTLECWNYFKKIANETICRTFKIFIRTYFENCLSFANF